MGAKQDARRAGKRSPVSTQDSSEDVRNSYLEPRIGQEIVNQASKGKATPENVLQSLEDGNEFDQAASTRASVNLNNSGRYARILGK
jgi:hypothetical protein